MKKHLGLILAFSGAIALFGTMLCILLVFLFKDDIERMWAAHHKYSYTLQLMRQSQWEKAVESAHELEFYSPDNKDYQGLYNEACRELFSQFLLDTKDCQPLERLAKLHEMSLRLGSSLDADGLHQFNLQSSLNESLVINDITAAFNTDLKSVETKIKGDESTFLALFSATNQPQAKMMWSACLDLEQAESAWNASNPVVVAQILDQVPDAYKTTSYKYQVDRLNNLRNIIISKVNDAINLASGEDYAAAMKLFNQLKGQETWINGLQQTRIKTQSDGQNYYMGKMFKSCLAHRYKYAGGWLKLLLQMQNKSVDSIDFDSVFASSSTAVFLSNLTSFGLHPARLEDRKDFTDVILVAADLPNLTDPEVANNFLAKSYYAWASLQAQNGMYETACYLALLAQKHGSESAKTLFETTRNQLLKLNKYSVSVVLEPSAPSIGASQDFCDTVFSSATDYLRNCLPAWVKLGESSSSAYQLQFGANISVFNSVVNEQTRTDSKEYPVYVTIDNPDFLTAQNNVTEDRAEVERLEQQLDTDRAVASAAESAGNAMSQGQGLFGTVVASVNTSVDQNALNQSERNVANAQDTLNDAQNTLNSTPRKIRSTREQLFYWDVTDYITTFTSTVQLSLSCGGTQLWKHELHSGVKHTSSSWNEKPEIALEGRERELPDLAAIKLALAGDLKSQIQALASSLILEQVKGAIRGIIDGSSANDAAQHQSDLGVEMLWWNTQLPDQQFLNSNLFLTQYGDVVNCGGSVSETKNASDNSKQQGNQSNSQDSILEDAILK